MCGSSKNTQTTKEKSTQTTAPNKEAMSVYQDLLSRLKGIGQTDYSPYAGARVAQFSPEQTAALAAMQRPGGAAGDIYQQGLQIAQQAAGPITEADINRFMNPYTGSVVDTTLNSMQRGFDRDVNSLKGDAISAKAFGGDRAGIAEATLRSQQADSRAKVEADLRARGFDSATANALAERQQMTSSLPGIFQAAQGIEGGWQSAFNAGEAQRALSQANFDVPYQDYLEERAYPYQQLQFMAGIGTGVGSQMGGTTTGNSTSKTQTPGPSIFSQIAGLGLGFMGLPTNSIGGSWFGRAEGGRVPEARAYEPSWRDQIAMWLLGEGKPSPEAANLVESLLGSRGMGMTGTPALVDMTPVGAPLNLQESYSSAKDGDYIGSALNFGDAAFAFAPMGTAASRGRHFVEDMVDRRVAKDLDGYPRMPEMEPGELDFLTKIQSENLSPRVRRIPELVPANSNRRLEVIGKAEGGAVGDNSIIEDAVAMAKRLKEDRDVVLGPKPQAELRNYEPSLRDRIAAFLMGEGKPSPERRRLVEGALGSSGLGETGGLNVADAIPGISQALNAGDAYSDINRGDYGGAILDLVEGYLPMAGIGKAAGAVPNAISPEMNAAQRKIAEEIYIKLMSDPKISVSPKTLRAAIEDELVKRGAGVPDDVGTLASGTMKYQFPWTNLSNPDSVKADLGRMRSLRPGKTFAEGGAVGDEGRNWLGLDPASSRALFAAGMAMMAGRSPYAGVNIGTGGLAGLAAYDDWKNTQADLDYKNRKLSQDADLENERLEIARKQLEVKPEFELVKEMVTKDGRPVVMNKATGRYHDATTGRELSEGDGVQSIKKKYSDLPVGVQKEIIDTRDIIQSSANTISNLKRAMAINDQAYSGWVAGPRGWVKSLTEGNEGGPGTATEELENIIIGGTLDSLKATFGAAPTEGERQILKELQGSVDKAPQVRAKIFERAVAVAMAREEYNKRKAQAMVDGTYFTDGFDQAPLDFENFIPQARGLLQGSQAGVMRKQFRSKDGSMKWGISKDGGKTWEPE